MRADLLDILAGHYRTLLGDRLVGLALYGSRARGDARPDSDVDLMLIADALPTDAFDRARLLHLPRLAAGDPGVQLRSLTPAEYERDIAPIDLDVALDAVILHDRGGYLAKRLDLVRRRIEEAGLWRAPDLTWRWRRSPRRADWEVGWQGVRL